MSLRAVLFACIVAVALSACGDPIRKQQITCNAESVEKGKLKGSGSTNRFKSNDFGPATARGEAFQREGKYGLITRHGAGAVHYQIDQLVAGEHFSIKVWRNNNSPRGQIRVLCPSVENPKFEWQLRRATSLVKKDWTLMGVDVTVAKRMAGKSLHVLLLPGDNDSIAWFDQFSIEHLSRPHMADVLRRKAITIDKRDGRTYRLVQIEDAWWMAEDLVYGNPKGIYTYSEALAAVPEGCRLATDQDWKNLERYLGVWGNVLDSTGGRGKNVSFRMLEGGDSGLDFLPTTEARANAYWTATSDSDSTAWARFLPRFTGIGRASAPHTRKLRVRCILNH